MSDRQNWRYGWKCGDMAVGNMVVMAVTAIRIALMIKNARPAIVLTVGEYPPSVACRHIAMGDVLQIVDGGTR